MAFSGAVFRYATAHSANGKRRINRYQQHFFCFHMKNIY